MNWFQFALDVEVIGHLMWYKHQHGSLVAYILAAIEPDKGNIVHSRWLFYF